MATASAASDAIQFNTLGLQPVLFEWGWFQLRWYSLAYLFGIIIGWWYLLKLLRQPGAPMARRHADDMAFYATLGIILGGRLGYVIFYKPLDYLQNPAEIIRLWDGGMSFHGGVIGVSLGILYLAWRRKLDWLRIHDYVACCIPPGLFLGRLANFVNGELWGGPTSVPWAVRFCEPLIDGRCMLGPPRHPSQLYEALLEGLFLMALLWFMFWKTRARYQPGKLVGTFILVYGLVRFGLEFIREPDAHLIGFVEKTGLHMGQWLSLPMILGGIYLVATAKKREDRVRPVVDEDAAPAVETDAKD
jgi:phosphatidylglycerol:prolipoprotein diacylglycerol transferase